jgi:hypothetical protein
VMSATRAKELGLTPLARFVGFAVAGVAPEIMGIGPVEAVPKVCKQTGVALKDIDVIELNEAFAAQGLAVMRKLDLDPDKVNVNGGAIALGHPLGCTGAKLTATAIAELHRRQARYALVTMCIGGGMGAAGIFERPTTIAPLPSPFLRCVGAAIRARSGSRPPTMSSPRPASSVRTPRWRRCSSASRSTRRGRTSTCAA